MAIWFQCDECDQYHSKVVIEYYARIDRDGCPECNPMGADMAKQGV